MKIIFVVLLIGITSKYAYTLQVCTTPDNKYGLCMNVRDCDCMVLFLLSKGNFTMMESEFLNKYQCNSVNEPMLKICCPHNKKIVSSLDGSLKAETPETARIKNHVNLRLLPNDTVCGQIKQVGERIQGGNETELLEFPWMALLSYQTGNGLDFQCGGTMISTRYILTAAHCIKPNLIGVRMGEYSIKNETDCDVDEDNEMYCAQPLQDFYVEEAIIHPNYNKYHKLGDDIGLIRVNLDIDLTRNSVKPICLPTEEAVIEKLNQNTQFTVTGWGRTENASASDILLQAQIIRISREDCQQKYNNQMYTITENQICAEGLQGSDSCNGDSGGPIQTIVPVNGVFHYVQGGIVSFGSTSCDNKDIPGVYTKVEKYMNWILDTMTD